MKQQQFPSDSSISYVTINASWNIELIKRQSCMCCTYWCQTFKNVYNFTSVPASTHFLLSVLKRVINKRTSFSETCSGHKVGLRYCISWGSEYIVVKEFTAWVYRFYLLFYLQVNWKEMASSGLNWPLRSLLRSSAPPFWGSRKLFVLHSQVSIWPLRPLKCQFEANWPQKWPQMTSEVKVLLQWLALLFDLLQLLFYSVFVRNGF